MTEPSDLEPNVGQTRTVGTSPKAIAAGTVGGILGLVIAIINGLSDQPDLLGTLPPWLQGVILVVAGAAGTGGAAYAAAPGTTIRRPVP